MSLTGEGNIQLTWSSLSNEVYEIDEADALVDTNTGSTTWNLLCDDYPSQGTNTFWLDTGNYNFAPPILSPKDMPMRFYRVVDKGPDDLIADEPTVSILSPANSAVVSGLLTVSVQAVSDQGNLFPKLYVDGQVMRASQDGSNYFINTCEWQNGPHVLFATVDSLTQPDGPSVVSSQVGHGVSPFVDVTFSNLISEIAFSQQSFQPDWGQTQQVSATFEENCDWILTIRDAFSNEVRTATGSGTALQFGWDGTGDGGTQIPNGIYYYYISAQPNGESPDAMMVGGGGFSSAAVTALSGAEDASKLWAVSPREGEPVPLALYPPGSDTNGLTIFEASPADVKALAVATMGTSIPARGKNSRIAANHGSRDGSFHPDGLGGGSGESSPPAPLRPPTPPCKGSVGKFGVAYQMYNANGESPIPAAILTANLPGVRSYIQMEGHSGTVQQPFAAFKNVDLVAANFVSEMQNGCWEMGYWEHDDALRLSSLQGSGNPFNATDLGLLICHGTYGTSSDYTTGHPLMGIYFPIASGGSASYLRMTDMSMGGTSPTNGLKWMAILACNSLYERNWTSMMNQNAKPYNGNLHLILGTDTEDGADPLIGQYWADYMLGDPTVSRAAMSIRLAWYNAAYYAYLAGSQNGTAYPNPTKFAVAGDSACMGDRLQTNSVPGGGWTYDSLQVYPPGSPPPTQ